MRDLTLLELLYYSRCKCRSAVVLTLASAFRYLPYYK
jgi:hypothetical protein